MDLISRGGVMNGLDQPRKRHAVNSAAKAKCGYAWQWHRKDTQGKSGARSVIAMATKGEAKT